MNLIRQSCILLVISTALIAGMVHRGKTRNKLLYILLDAFRYDYVKDQPPQTLPGFSKFLENGVQAEYMIPIFPSLSYPDWTTLVTGLNAESHGIVGNYFYDPEDNDTFSLFDEESTGKKKWWAAEPIWTTATKAGLKVAVILWSRCDVPFDGVVPEYCEKFVKITGYEIFRTNIDKAIAKLEDGFDLVQVYNQHMDDAGHNIGPETEARIQAVKELDDIILYLQNTLKEKGMEEEVNIVIVSDHGMTPTAPGTVKRVELDDYLLTDYVENVAEYGAFCNIKAIPEYIDEVYEKLKTMPGVMAYKHDDIPEELHFKDNEYIHDIILKADIGTFIMPSRSSVQTPPRDDTYVYNGAHGYDPREEKMWAIFFAKGPDFKSNAKIPAFKNLDVYPLLTHLLQMDPRPNNGSLKVIGQALKGSGPVNKAKRKGIPKALLFTLPFMIVALFL